MSRTEHFVVLLAACGLLMTAQPEVASAGRVIDAFDTPIGKVVNSNDGPLPVSATQNVTDGSVIGNYRQAEITAADIEVDLSIITTGQLAYTTAPVDAGTAILTYSANGAGLGVDLREDGASFFVFDVTFLDQSSADVTIGVADSSSNTATKLVNVSSIGRYVLPFADFLSVDFTDIDEISMRISTTSTGPAVDINFDGFRTEGIPEPSTLVLFGLGAVAMYGTVRLRSRKRKSQT